MLDLTPALMGETLASGGSTGQGAHLLGVVGTQLPAGLTQLRALAQGLRADRPQLCNGHNYGATEDWLCALYAISCLL